jgi:hypothetical protein
VNVLRDTHRALHPGSDLLDFHPTFPPWARVEAGGRALGDLEEREFPEQLRAAEAGMDEAVRLGLFRLVTERTHELREHYDDADDLIDTWEDIVEPELERRIRASTAPFDVVDKVVFRLYRTV